MKTEKFQDLEVNDHNVNSKNQVRELTVSYYDSDGNEIVEELHFSMEWEICGVCRGKGSHSLALGAITQEDRDQNWDSDEFENYMQGGYDSQCDDCRGDGKVLVDCEKTKFCSELEKQAYRLFHDGKESDAEYDRICAMERKMGA